MTLKTPQAREQISGDTIPVEIIKAAEECVIHLPEVSGATRWILRDLISRAINNARMAERERCWAIANAAYRANATGSGFDSQPARATAYEIREAIRPAAPKAEAA